MHISSSRVRVILVALAVTIVLVCTASLIWWKNTSKPKLVYVNQGYGGFTTPGTAKKAKPKSVDPLQPVISVYNSGRYKEAEKAAERVIEQTQRSKDPKVRKNAARARYVMAFAAARQENMELARERFATLRTEAAKLPDKGKVDSAPGQMPLPTLEEDAAYQHAVCTAALGDKKAAEEEYKQFLRDYPESTLIHGVVQRVARMHGGDAPPEVEKLWEQARRTGEERQKAREREKSLCGPECLAELLRRRGEKEDVHVLAKEMNTTHEGTSLKSLADVARKHGFKPKGLSLTYKGLMKQKLPAIVLVTPGHFVIVDKVTPTHVTVWRPGFKERGISATTQVTTKKWEERWKGITLAL